MMQHTNNTLFALFATSMFFLSCNKIVDANNSLEIKDSIIVNSKPKENLKKTEKILGEEWNFYSAYYQRANEEDKPEIYEEDVVDKFNKIKISLSTDSIWIDNNVSSYKIETMDSKQYYIRQYVYENYVDAFKNGYNIDISKKISCLRINYESYLQAPFYDYFKEGGSIVFVDSCLFLNYKEYLVCYKKYTNKSWDKINCVLPFDYWKMNCLCQMDLRKKYLDLCSNEYPIFYFNENDQFKKIIENETKQINPSYYFNVKSNLPNIKIIVVVYVAEESDESYGDEKFVITIKDNKVISSMKDPDDLIHYKNFIINEDLSIFFYDNNGLRPKGNVFKTYQINQDGSFTLKSN